MKFPMLSLRGLKPAGSKIQMKTFLSQFIDPYIASRKRKTEYPNTINTKLIHEYQRNIKENH